MGRIPVNIEYENNKQNIEILIIERTDIRPLLCMDWMKAFKLTIGGIKLVKNSQSERQRIFGEFQDLFENNKTIKDRNKHPTKTGTLPSRTKSKTGTTTSIRRRRKGIRKTNLYRTPRKHQRCSRRLFCIAGSNHSKK